LIIGKGFGEKNGNLNPALKTKKKRKRTRNKTFGIIIHRTK
jgi:hypothetical protein